MKQVLAAILAIMFAAAAFAQTAWIQVEAHPTLAEAREAAGRYARQFSQVEGYRLNSGWYGVVLGPLDAAEARAELRRLRIAGAVPRDSFVAEGARFREPFWPDGAITAVPLDPPGTSERPAAGGEAITTEVETQIPDRRPAQIVPRPSDETAAEARQTERLLSPEERRLLQVALQWEGVYDGTIDGAFGRGTRDAMAAWQRQQGAEPTGILTSAQRAALMRSYSSAFDGLGMAQVRDEAAGISVEMPMEKVRRAGEVPPFVTYEASDADGIQVILLSQEGDRRTLAALYDVLQSLAIMPLEGPRALRATSFTITGASEEIVSQAEAWLADGAVKGFLLVWPAGDERRRERVVERMRASFETLPGMLPEGSTTSATGPTAVLDGLEVRRPERSRTGFFVDRTGQVLTAAEAVADCGRVTLNGEVEARVVASDPALELALLAPVSPLAPMSVARFSTGAPRRGAEIAVSGFAYEGRLGAPTLSYGAVEELRGLDGDERVHRLALTQVPGEAGGPVLDAGGGVVGLLLPREEAERRLPDGVSFAASGAAAARFLSENGVTPEATESGAPLAPEDLTALGAEMSVLVACWT